MTSDDKTHDAVGTSRRDLLTRIGEIGTIGLGATGLTAGEEDSSVRILEGKERAEVLRQAVRSDDLREIHRRLHGGFRPRRVFEFERNSQSSKGAIFVDSHRDIQVKYYTPKSFIGERAFAYIAVGDGIRSFDTKSKRWIEIETPRALEIRELVERQQTTSGAESLTSPGIVVTDEALDVVTYRTSLTKNDEAIGRIGFEIDEKENGPYIVDRDVIYRSRGVSIAGHEGCVFGWCADGCHVLCTALGGASNAGCRAACVYSGAGLIFSAGCGQVCQAITYGACYPSCKAVVH
jgi:hypothetical protein